MAGPFSPREQLRAFVAWGARLRRGAPIGIVALALGLIGTVALTLSTHRLYRSEAVLSYQKGTHTLGSDEGISSRALGSRVSDLMTSRERLGGLIKEMGLYPSIVDRKGPVEAIDEMRKHLRISSHEGYMVEASYDGESRQLAKDVLDKLIASIIEQDNKDRAREADDALKFIGNERRQADEDLKAKDAALSVFLEAHPQLAEEVGNATSGGLLRAADRDRGIVPAGDVAGLELQAAQIQEALAAAGARPTTAAASVGMADPALVVAETKALSDLQAARVDLADKQTRLTNEHPDVKMAVRRVALAEAAQRSAVAAVAASRSAPAEAAAGAAGAADDGFKVAALRRALAAVQQQLASARSRGTPHIESLPKNSGSMVAIDTEWTRLNRELAEARERQSTLQSKEFQAELTSMLTTAGEGPRLVVVDRPFQPQSPIAGGRSKIAMAGTAGSLVLALLAVAVFSAFDDRLYAVPDVQRLVSDCLVVVIPSMPRRPDEKVESGESDQGESGTAGG